MLPVLPYTFVGSSPRLSSEVNSNFQYIVNFLNQGASGTVDGGVQHDNFALNSSVLNFAVSGVNALTCTFSANRSTVPVVSILSTADTNDAPFYVSAAPGTGSVLNLAPSNQAVGLEAKTSGIGAALEIVVSTSGTGIRRSLASSVVPLTVTGINSGAFYGAFATLPTGQSGAVTYDTTDNRLKWYDNGVFGWRNVQAGWGINEITEIGGALAVTGTVSSTKLGPPNIYFGSGTIANNSSTDFPANASHSVTFTKTAAHTTLLCTLSGTNVAGGGLAGGSQTNYLVLGIFVNGVLRRTIPLMHPSIGGDDSAAFLAFYAPIDGVSAGTVTVDLRIRKGTTGSATVYLTGATLQVIEL
jgi:hypothetical protein